MRILFVTDNFPPEVNAPANRTYEHCSYWAAKGEQVTVITGAPNFPEGKLLAGYKNKLFQREQAGGIRVWRVWSYITANKGIFKRTLDYVSFAVSAVIAGLFARTDIIVATSPQFFVACAGYVLSVLKRKPWVFEVRDLWPESIKAVGAMKDSPLLRLFEKLEAFLYKRATVVVVVTDSFKQTLLTRGVDERKIKVLKNGVLLSAFHPREKDGGLIRGLKLEGKTIILYAGTIGMAHALDFIVQSASKLHGLSSLHFVILGTGAEAESVKALINELRPANVTFLPPVPRAEMPRYLSIADFALVNLKQSETFKTVLPSKIFENAAMGIPILLGVEGEAKELVDRYQAGLSFEPENFESLRSALQLIASREVDISNLKNGALRLASDFDRERLAAEMLIELQAASGL